MRGLCSQIAFTLLLGAGIFAGADVAPAQEKDKVDAFGDPLPPGATARLGTTRLRPGGRIWRLAYSPDGKRLACWSEAGLSVYDAATGRELRRVEVSVFFVYAFAWPEAGRGLAVLPTGDDGFYVWNFADEKAQRPPVAPGPRFGFGVMVVGQDYEKFSHFAFSPDGKFLAAGRSGQQKRERQLDLYEVAAGKRVSELKRLRTLGPQPGNCRGLAFTPDGQSLLAFSGERGDKEERLSVWDPATGEERKRLLIAGTNLPSGQSPVFAVGPDGRTLALGMPDGTARLWDLALGKETRSVARHVQKIGAFENKGVTALAFIDSGRTLITSGRDQATRAWDVETGREVLQFGREYSWVQAIVASPDGKHIASAGQDGRIRLRDAATGADIPSPDGHNGRIKGVAVAADNRTAATLSGDETIRLWDLATGRERRRIDFANRYVTKLSFTPDGKALLLGGENGPRMWDASTAQPLPLPGGLADYRGTPWGFSADGRTLLTSDRGALTLWDWPAGRPRQKVQLADEKYSPAAILCSGASLSPDGRLLATCSMGQGEKGGKIVGPTAFVAVELWDTATGKRIQRLRLDGVSYPRPVFAPDGRSLLLAGMIALPFGTRNETGTLAKAINFWSVDPLKPRRGFDSPRPGREGDMRHVHEAVFSPDGRTLAVAEDQRTVTLYEVASGGVRRRLAGHRGNVTALAFTPDSRRLLTASEDHTGLVWDVTLAGAARDVPPVPLTAAEKDKVWKTLGSAEAKPAYQALARLATEPAAVALIRERLKPAAGPDDATLDRLRKDLSSEKFVIREKASAELDRWGDVAVPGVQVRLAKASSLELRRRLEQFLDKHDRGVPSPERLREGRAVELLEQIGSAEARALLRELAGGVPTVRLTQDAAASLRRLERKGP